MFKSWYLSVEKRERATKKFFLPETESLWKKFHLLSTRKIMIQNKMLYKNNS